jgi:hypothetical protein
VSVLNGLPGACAHGWEGIRVQGTVSSLQLLVETSGLSPDARHLFTPPLFLLLQLHLEFHIRIYDMRVLGYAN